MAKKYSGFVAIASIFIVGLFMIYYLDPTHDYPELNINTPLHPNETFTFSTPDIPKSLFGMIEYIFKIHHIEIAPKIGGAGLVFNEMILQLFPGVIMGIDIDGKNQTIINLTNETISLDISITQQPDLKEQAKFKNYWYIILSVLNIFFTLILSISNIQIIPINRASISKPSIWDSFILFFCGCCSCCLSKKTKSGLLKNQTIKHVADDRKTPTLTPLSQNSISQNTEAQKKTPQHIHSGNIRRARIRNAIVESQKTKSDTK